MTSESQNTMPPDCRDFIAGIEARAEAAKRQARKLPRIKRQAFLYDATFRNDIEAVAYPLAKVLGRLPDFATPTTYCEKMRGLYLTHPNSLMSLAADKAEMHRLCAHLDTPIRPPALYAVYDDPRSLALSDLPQTAMLKVSDGCKMNILHGPGLPVTSFAYRRFLRDKWHIDHWRRHGELHYRDIPRRLLVEEALLPIEKLTETCIFCAFGTPYLLSTKYGYTWQRHTATIGGYVALEDRLKPLERDNASGSTTLEEACPAPFRDAMFETARLLSDALPNCRVDFMFSGGRCYLGEITVSSGAFTNPYKSRTREALRSSLFDLSKLPETLAKGREIAAALGWPIETSFGHYAPNDPRLATGGQ